MGRRIGVPRSAARFGERPVLHSQFGRSRLAGPRPALVLSSRAYSKTTGLAVICPITSRVKGYPFECPLPAESRVSGVVLADTVRNVDFRSRRIDFVERAPEALLHDVFQALRRILPGILP